MLVSGKKSPAVRTRVGLSSGPSSSSTLGTSPKPTTTSTTTSGVAPKLRMPTASARSAASPSALSSGGRATPTASARSGSAGNTAAARSNSAGVGRSSSVQSNNAAAATTGTTAGGTRPYHRPLLSASLHAPPSSSSTAKKVPVSRMTPAINRTPVTTSRTVGGGISARSGSAGTARSASTGSNAPVVDAKKQAAARITRSPSPAKIPQKRCKHCSGLVGDLEAHMADCPCAPRECKERDSETGTPFSTSPDKKGAHSADPHMCSFVARGAQHLKQHKETECPFRRVECRNAGLGCTSMVSVASMDRHIQHTCAFSLCVCEFCSAQITRGMHPTHVEVECPNVMVLCPLGCGREMARSSVNAHIFESWNDPKHSRGSAQQQQQQQGAAASDDQQQQQQQQAAATRIPPENLKRVAQSLLNVLDSVTQSRDAEAILAPSDEVDTGGVPPLGGATDSSEHSIFVGQSVLRSIAKLEKYCDPKQQSQQCSAAIAQSVFELVEKRAETAKTRLAPHAASSQVANAVKNALDTSLGKVALKVCELK